MIRCVRAFVWIVILWIGTSVWVIAQDVAYTQFMTNPLAVNPALSGKYNGSFRLSGNYRDYGFRNVEHTMKSYTLSGDMRFEIPNQFQTFKDMASFGFIFQSNRVNVFDYNQNNVALVGAYQKALGTYLEQYLGIGFAVGVLQKSINYEDLTFSDQFNAIDKYILPTGEELPQNNVAAVDLSIGVDYKISIDEQTNYTIGLALHHLTRGDLSFYKSSNKDNIPEKKDKIFDKQTTYIVGDHAIGYTYHLQPRLILHNQKDHLSLLAGTNFKILISKPRQQYFHVGPWIRITRGTDGVQVPYVSLSTAMEYRAFSVGVSFDYGISNKVVSNLLSTNALELSFQYFGEVDNTDQFFPKF